MSLHYTSDASISIRPISRNVSDYTRSGPTDLYKKFSNLNPKIHPFDRAREYVRALNTTKLDRVFARPYLHSYDLHIDTVNSITTIPNDINNIISVDASGNIIGYNIALKKCNFRINNAHTSAIRGVACTSDGEHFITCSLDSTVKLYNYQQCIDRYTQSHHTTTIPPQHQWLGESAYNSVDTYYNSSDSEYSDTFVTGGSNVSLWNIHRSEPIHSFTWGVDNINTVQYNRVECNVLASTASDRNIVLYDVRSKSPIRKIVMTMQTNTLCWNPQQAYIFSTGNEDTNAYTFDMRNLSHAIQVYEDHVSAVMSLDYNPTGTELVTGSYDKTIRLYSIDTGHSRDVYYTKRMQRLFSVRYTLDSKYVVSGSDDSNVRVWKSNASQKLKPVYGRERLADNYKQKLKLKYQHIPQIQRIARHRHLPKMIYKAIKLKHIARQSVKRKADRVRAHTKPDKQQPYVSKKQTVVKEQLE